MKLSMSFRSIVLSRASALLALALLLAGGVVSAADWPQYRGPNLDGTTTEKVQTPWPAAGPRQIWKTPVNAGFSAFAVAGGKAFTLVTREEGGVKNETCVALDASTGKELWAAPLAISKYDGGGDSGASGNKGGDGPRSTPTVDADRVYVLTAPLVLHCLDSASGKMVWKKDLVKEHGARNITWQNAASPVLEGNLVFVCAGGEGQSLLCFHKTTGAVVWKGQSDRMTHATPVVATIGGHRQVIFLTQSGLVAVIPGTGEVLWRHKFPYSTSTAASPVVGGDMVYCSAGYGVGATAVKVTKDGAAWKATELWRKSNQLMNHWSTAVYRDGHIYGLFGFKKYEEVPLKCIEMTTGREKWSRDGFGQGGTILAANKVVALAENGDLVVVEASPATYTELARHKAVAGKCWNNPALSEGRIYARSTREGVCLDVSEQLAEK